MKDSYKIQNTRLFAKSIRKNASLSFGNSYQEALDDLISIHGRPHKMPFTEFWQVGEYDLRKEYSADDLDQNPATQLRMSSDFEVGGLGLLQIWTRHHVAQRSSIDRQGMYVSQWKQNIWSQHKPSC